MTMTKQRVLVTGAAGRIGSHFARHCGESSSKRLLLRLSDLDPDGLKPLADCSDEPVRTLDVTDARACREACEGVDVVLHLANKVDPDAGWDELLPVSVVGTYNVFTAAVEAGCKKVIFASSAQTIEGYPKDVQPDVSHPVRPGNIYGVCKCFGEALAAHYAYTRGLAAVCVRIANHRPVLTPETKLSMRDASAYLSPGDCTELLARSIEADTGPFAIVNGVSDNRYKRLRMDATCELLGLELQDDAFKVLAFPSPAATSDPAF